MLNNRILIADDEPDIGDIITAVAEDMGFEATYVREGDKVVSRVSALNPSVILLDLRMPGADGVEILRELAKTGCTARIVLISGMDQRTLNTVESLGKEKNLDIVGTLTKPMHPDQIEGVLAPFKDEAQIPAQGPSLGTGKLENQYGPGIYFAPQQLMSESAGDTRRVVLDLGWRLDDGRELRGETLFTWAGEQQATRGMLALWLGEALRQWQGLGSSGNGMQFVLPLTIGMLGDANLVQVISGTSRQFGFPPASLIIETDESGIHGNGAIEALSRLRIAGFRTAFITESDSEALLTMIDKLPMDEIVVDLSSLKGEQGFESNMELEFSYSSLTSLARRKQLKTSARGVSTEHIAEFVKRCRFDWAEGSEIGGRVPITELAQYNS